MIPGRMNISNVKARSYSILAVLCLLLLPWSAAASDETAIETLCGYYGERLDAAVAEHRMLLASPDELARASEEVLRLEETRHRLELEGLEAERSVLDLLCAAGTELTLEERHLCCAVPLLRSRGSRSGGKVAPGRDRDGARRAEKRRRAQAS